MKREVLAIFLLFAVSAVSSQTAVCLFMQLNGVYTCTATLINPSGFDNFTRVEGVHFGGETDDDVLRIERNAASNSPNFPSIFCSQFRNIRAIIVDQIGLERIEERSFGGCGDLRDLTLARNRINFIHENAFSENRNLSYLDLSGNDLVTLPETLFANQIDLHFLYLDTNRIQELPSAIFYSLNNLSVLRIGVNELSSLPDGLFNKLINLSILSFSMNRITSVNQNLLQSLYSLESISMGFNQLTEIPPYFFGKFPFLNSIFISGNNLTALHLDSFGYLPELSSFWFEHNQIDAIDGRIFANRSLFTLTAGPNPCVDRNGVISNPNAVEIASILERCFENYNNLETTTGGPTTEKTTGTTEPYECEVGNVDERICKLEVENASLRERIERLEKIVLGLG